MPELHAAAGAVPPSLPAVAAAPHAKGKQALPGLAPQQGALAAAPHDAHQGIAALPAAHAAHWHAPQPLCLRQREAPWVLGQDAARCLPLHHQPSTLCHLLPPRCHACHHAPAQGAALLCSGQGLCHLCSSCCSSLLGVPPSCPGGGQHPQLPTGSHGSQRGSARLRQHAPSAPQLPPQRCPPRLHQLPAVGHHHCCPGALPWQQGQGGLRQHARGPLHSRGGRAQGSSSQVALLAGGSCCGGGGAAGTALQGSACSAGALLAWGGARPAAAAALAAAAAAAAAALACIVACPGEAIQHLSVQALRHLDRADHGVEAGGVGARGRGGAASSAAPAPLGAAAAAAAAHCAGHKAPALAALAGHVRGGVGVQHSQQAAHVVEDVQRQAGIVAHQQLLQLWHPAHEAHASEGQVWVLRGLQAGRGAVDHAPLGGRASSAAAATATAALQQGAPTAASQGHCHGHVLHIGGHLRPGYAPTAHEVHPAEELHQAPHQHQAGSSVRGAQVLRQAPSAAVQVAAHKLTHSKATPRQVHQGTQLDYAGAGQQVTKVIGGGGHCGAQVCVQLTEGWSPPQRQEVLEGKMGATGKRDTQQGRGRSWGVVRALIIGRLGGNKILYIFPIRSEKVNEKMNDPLFVGEADACSPCVRRWHRG